MSVTLELGDSVAYRAEEERTPWKSQGFIPDNRRWLRVGLRRWQDGADILLRYKVKICQLSRNSELAGSRGENKEKIRSGAGEGMTTGVRQELNGMLF